MWPPLPHLVLQEVGLRPQWHMLTSKYATDPSMCQHHGWLVLHRQLHLCIVRLFYHQAEQDRSKVPVTDLDTILPEGELRDAKVLFWRRYKLRFPTELHPADSTVSRVAREMDKRMLCVFNLWKVKSLQFQLHCTQKKRKLGEGLTSPPGSAYCPPD